MTVKKIKYGMKVLINIRGRRWLHLIFMILVAQSCDQWIDPEINVNPDEPADASMETLLSFIEADVAFKMGGSSELIGNQGIWLQQLDGIDRQALSMSNYIFDPFDVTLTFDDAYAEVLMDAKVLAGKAIEQGSPWNFGVANILSAFTLGQLTDTWGDIPWTEALQGDAITQPVYDSQESIYNVIQALLDQAIDSLSVENDRTGINGDYYYNGDPLKWIKAAHALKARYYLHLSKRWGKQAFDQALEQVVLAFSTNEDDLQFNFGSGETESNPFYQFMNERDNARMGAYFINLMKATNDPRLVVFAAPDEQGDYSGSEPGQADASASRPGQAVAAPDSPVYLITWVEMLFTKAEALLKIGADETEVSDVLFLAVSRSLDKYNVTDLAWLDEYVQKISTLAGEDLYKEIMTQKYIATFYQPEAFHSWRRTGYPVIPPNPNGETGEIPRRFLYSISEQVFNPNMPKGISITDRVWWDE